MAKPTGTERFVQGAKDLGSAGRVVISEGGGRLLGRSTGMAGRAASATGGGLLGLMGRVMSGVASQAKAHPVIALLVGAFAGIKIVQHFRNRGYEKQQIAEHAQAAQVVETMAAMGVSPEQAAALQQVTAMGITPEMVQLAQMQQQMGGAPSSMGPGQTDWVGRVTNQRQNEQLVGAGRRP